MEIRDEAAEDAATISALVTEAFAAALHSSGTEAAIVERLRNAGALSISLVAEDDTIIGHVAISPVGIGAAPGWFGLGPLAVRPESQNRGVGAALIRAALERLQIMGAQGCVVLGEPEYYGRFGFVHNGSITYGDVPPPYLQALAFGGPLPRGEVRYHPAFGA